MYSSTLKHLTMVLTWYIIDDFFVIEGSSENRVVKNENLSEGFFVNN